MSREEFLRLLEETLAGEVPPSVIRENLDYYKNYISQETAKGRTVDEIVQEIGDPRLIARTIIDSSEAAGETAENGGREYGDGYGREGASGSGYGQRPESGEPNVHYFDLNKWYWKILIIAAVFLVISVVMGIIGGIFSLLFRFAGPLLILALVFWFIRSMRR